MAPWITPLNQRSASPSPFLDRLPRRNGYNQFKMADKHDKNGLDGVIRDFYG